MTGYSHAIGAAATACLVAGLCLAADADEKPEPNEKIAAMSPHSWLRIGGPPPAPKGIMAYSGGVFDSQHNVFLIFGGGHADYWGNEVCAFDLKTLAWRKMYKPDARNRYTNDNIDNVKGKLKDSDKPYTRHSYQMLAFVPTKAQMFIWSGCGPGWGAIKPTCPAPPDAWYYDYASNKWAFVVSGGPKGYGGGTCYDGKRDVVWALPGGSWPPLWKFDVKTSTWSRRPIKPDSACGMHTNLVYNARRDRIVAGAGGKGVNCYLIDPATARAEKTDTSRFKTVGHGGMVMLPDQDAALHLAGDRRLGVLDFDAKAWYPLEAPDGGPKMMGYAVYGRFNYSAIDKVALFVGPAGVYAYKPPAAFDFKALAEKSAPPPPAKISPSSE